MGCFGKTVQRNTFFFSVKDRPGQATGAVFLARLCQSPGLGEEHLPVVRPPDCIVFWRPSATRPPVWAHLDVRSTCRMTSGGVARACEGGGCREHTGHEQGQEQEGRGSDFLQDDE